MAMVVSGYHLRAALHTNHTLCDLHPAVAVQLTPRRAMLNQRTPSKFDSDQSWTE
jgi:hypothetical protein